MPGKTKTETVQQHVRLDLSIVDTNAQHCSSAMRRNVNNAPAAAQAERANETKYGTTKGGRHWAVGPVDQHVRAEL